jgi:thiol-disulfide isomerase/thioredoxin
MKLRLGALVTGVTTGLIALIAVLAGALAGGLLWRLGNGRMRPVGAAAGRGPLQPDDPAEALAAAATAGLRLTSEELGHELGERATLIQFSSAFCAPCRATRRVLTEVAGMTEGVTYIEVDAESRLDLVRSLNVLRTPTVMVTDAAGRIVKRASGQPRKPDVIAALGQAVPHGTNDARATDIAHIAGRE